MIDIYQTLLQRLKETRRSQILTTVLNDYGYGKVAELERGFEERLTKAEQEQVLKHGQPIFIEREGAQILAEPFYQRERLIVFGGGHVAKPVVEIAKMIGFYVIVVDDRQEFASTDRFPNADQVICDEFDHCLTQIQPTLSDYFVIVTRGHVSDMTCVKELMKYPESVYIGMIGSRKRTSKDLAMLVQEGYDEERLNRICTPIGLPIGAMTTEEIAVSILAEIIRRKRMESRYNQKIDRGDGELFVIEALSDITENAVVATILEAEGSAPRKAGAKMIVFQDGTIIGTIGGGRMEASIIEKAEQMLGSRRYEVLDIRLDGEAAMAEGMTCGGRVKILLEDWNGKNKE